MAARTPISNFVILPGGTTLGLTSADTVNGHKFLSGDRVFLRVFNGDASSRNVTLILPPPPDLADAADPVIAVAAGEIKHIGPFPPGVYDHPTAEGGDPSDAGFCWLTLGHAAMTVSVIRGR
jgi:hypothetical protein